MSERLFDLGLDDAWQAIVRASELPLELVGRVTSEHPNYWTVACADGEFLATMAGRLRHDVETGDASRPVVGDWVALRAGDPGDEQRVIVSVLPRRTWIERKAAGKTVVVQTLAANVDTAFLLVALGRDVNERRIERFATILAEGGVRLVVVLSKADLVDDPAPYAERARAAAPTAEVHVISALTGTGLHVLDPYLAPPTTVAVIGTSGAGKSTLVNRWLGGEIQATTDVRADSKGRHTTTTRALLSVRPGTLVLDTPGLREVGVWDGEEGLDDAFPDVTEVAAGCRFGDCRHDGEPGCAVAAAVVRGDLAPDRVTSWQFLRREQDRIATHARQGVTRREASKRERSMAVRKHLAAKGRK